MKKSKFQERLNKAAKNYDPEEDKGSMNDQVKLHKMNVTWISVDIEKPPCYATVNIWDGKQIFYNWARVFDGEKDYYVTDYDKTLVKTDVTFWSYPEEVTYPKYEPMTAEDIPGYELTQLIKAMKKKKAMSNNYYSQVAAGFNTGIEECIQIVERRLKRIQKAHQVKLHNRNTTDLK